MKRAIQGVLTIIVVTIVIFLLFQLMPGSPIDNFRGDPTFNRAKLEQLNQTFGINDPFYVKMGKYLYNMFSFNFGPSFLASEPVVDVLRDALPRTLFLFGGAVIIEYILGVIVGRYIAWKRGRFSEGATIIMSLFFYNMPSFWIGLILLWFFAFSLAWFPLRGYGSCTGTSITTCTFTQQHYAWLAPLGTVSLTLMIGGMLLIAGVGLLIWGIAGRSRGREGFGIAGAVVGSIVVAIPFFTAVNFSVLNLADWSIHAFLPMLALVAISSAGTILLMQTSMLEVMGEDFILTARAKGLSERVVRKRHAARNAYLPIVTSLAISLGFVVGGAIVLEQIFSYSGLGYYFLQAVERHDQFLAGADLFLIAILVICGNIIADIMYGVLDPRVRL